MRSASAPSKKCGSFFIRVVVVTATFFCLFSISSVSLRIVVVFPPAPTTEITSFAVSVICSPSNRDFLICRFPFSHFHILVMSVCCLFLFLGLLHQKPLSLYRNPTDPATFDFTESNKSNPCTQFQSCVPVHPEELPVSPVPR